MQLNSDDWANYYQQRVGNGPVLGFFVLVVVLLVVAVDREAVADVCTRRVLTCSMFRWPVSISARYSICCCYRGQNFTKSREKWSDFWSELTTKRYSIRWPLFFPLVATQRVDCVVQAVIIVMILRWRYQRWSCYIRVWNPYANRIDDINDDAKVRASWMALQ